MEDIIKDSEREEQRVKKYRTVRHYQIKFADLIKQLGINQVEEIIEIDTRSETLLVSTEEREVDKLL